MSFLTGDYLDLSRTSHAALFAGGEPPWTALARLADYLEERLDRAAAAGPLLHGEIHPGATVGPRVYLGPGAVVEAGAVIQGPAWIGEGCVARSGAYLRQHVIAGDRCVLGHSSEFKLCLLFDECEAPHFNYVGDSILGHRAHLGAGAICSNVRLDRGPVSVRDPATGETRDTGLRKFGAIVGDRAEVGCHAVLSPGSLLGRDTVVYPGTHWRGVLPASSVARHPQDLRVSPRR